MTGPSNTGAYRPLDWSIQLSPTTDGCGWVQINPFRPPACPQEPVYALTSPKQPGMVGVACVDHTALMRELHPEHVASVRLLARDDYLADGEKSQ